MDGKLVFEKESYRGTKSSFQICKYLLFTFVLIFRRDGRYEVTKRVIFLRK